MKLWEETTEQFTIRPLKSCHTCVDNHPTNSGCSPCRECQREESLINLKPRHRRKTDAHGQ